jgi:integrase
VAIKKFCKPGCTDPKKCDCPWRLTYRPQGTAGPMKRLNFPTKKAAEKYEAETKVAVSRGLYVDPNKVSTFAEAAETWLRGKADRRPSHVCNLQSRMRKHILPRFGNKRLDQISVADVENFRTDLKAELERRTVGVIVRMVKAIFRSAIRRGECSRNPCDGLEREFEAAKEIKAGEQAAHDAVDPSQVLDQNEMARLIAASPEGYFRTLFATAYVTGMRSGELLGLPWANVDLEAGTIRVRQSLSWASVAGEEVRARFYPPKTKAGIRDVSIPAALVSALKVWKVACPISENGLVFPREDGSPESDDRVRRAGLHPALKRAGLKQVRFHDLRHSCASAMIANGRPITEIQHRLGHSSPDITLRVYSHWFAETKSDSADQLAEGLFDAPRLRAVK